MFIIFLIVSYNSTAIGTNVILNNQVEAIIDSRVEKELVRELDNSQSSELEDDKSSKLQELEEERRQALLPKVWAEVNSQYKLKTWIQMGISIALYLLCLTLYYLNKFEYFSFFLIRLYSVAIGVFTILVILIITVGIPEQSTIFPLFFRSILIAVFSSFFSTIHISYFITKLINSLPQAKTIFSENKESSLLFSTIIKGIILGFVLSIFMDIRVGIILNCIAISRLFILQNWHLRW